MRLALLVPVLVLACETDLDCSLNGVCSAGSCVCDRPWLQTGAVPDCSLLDVLPSPTTDCGPGCVFHGGPSGVDQNWTSWGASVITDPKTGTLNMFVAEMANECGLGSWQRNSQVVHATATAPEGPWQRQSVVVEPLSHNPQAVIAPDGTIVIYTLFDGWPQNGVPQNCSSSGGVDTASAEMATSGWPFRGPGLRPAPRRPLDTGNCTVVAQPDNCDPGPCWRCNITLHASPSFDAPGPWESVPAAIIGLSNVDNIGNWNPAPLVLPNGSVALMIHTDWNGGWSGLAIAVADTWRGPYYVTVPDRAISNCTQCLEDPFMWIDARGHWHVLVHRMFDPPGGGPCGAWAGGHLFSEDGTSWGAFVRAYNTTLPLEGGGAPAIFQRRERPKLLFDASGRPTHLYNGAIAQDGSTYSIIAPLNAA